MKPAKMMGVLLWMWIGLSGSLLAQIQPEPEGSPEAATEIAFDPDTIIEIVIQEEGIPLTDFLKHASLTTGKIFVIGPQANAVLQGGRARNVKITRTIDVRRSDYFETFKAILKANNLHVYEIANPDVNLYIVDDLTGGASKGTARTKAVFVTYEELISDPSWSYRTEIISTVITLEHMDVGRAKSELTQLVNTREAGAITTIPASNSIIITDFAGTVYHIARMLSLMDQAESRFEMLFDKVALEHADPDELQPILADLLEAEEGGDFGGQQRQRQAGRGGDAGGGLKQAPPPKIIPDVRTNSLILYAVKEDMTKIKDLIGKLDEEVREVVPDIYRYQLKHAVADEVAETLSEVVEASGNQNRNRQAGNRGQQQGGNAAFVEQEIIIVPEPHTNSLLIRASSTQYAWISKLLDDIDQRLPQVLIEAAIVELSEDFTDSFGVELGLLDLNDNPQADITRGFGFTGFGLSTFIDNDGDGIPELRLPNLEGGLSGFTGGIFRFPGFQVPFILSMIGTDNQSNLLSIPSVLTNDNAAATITVSESQTTTTSSLGGGGLAQGGFGGFEEAPLTLSISPHISANDYLRLDIELLVESFTGVERQIEGQVIPAPKTSRELIAQVTVPNNATVVIGGLTQKLTTEDHSKVPFFGDLPFIGALFRKSDKMESKTTLYLFVTPHILKDRDFSDLHDYTYVKELEVEALIGSNIRLFDPRFEETKKERQSRGKGEWESQDYLDIPRYERATSVTNPED